MVSGICMAQTADSVEKLKQENAELRQRMEKMEQQFRALQSAVQEQATAKPTDQPRLSDAEIQRISSIVRKFERDAWPVVSSLKAQLYGAIRFEASYDMARTNDGDSANLVLSEQNRSDDNTFNMTAQNTILGLNIYGPSTDEVSTRGKFEIDFRSPAAVENAPLVWLREAYMEVAWNLSAEDRLSLIAGQTWEVVSPLVPPTLDWGAMWFEGNLGIFEPQLRLTYDRKLSDAADIKFELAAVRHIGRPALVGGVRFDPGDTGEDSGMPNFQGRVSVSFPGLYFGDEADQKHTTLGVSGHYGLEEYDLNAGNDHMDFDTWSVNLDLTQPLTKWLTLAGEAFAGQNLDCVMGGLGNASVVTATGNELTSRGGWAAAQLGPFKGLEKWQFAAGAGCEDANISDLPTGGITLNSIIFGNVIYAINKNVSIALQLSHLLTEYKNMNDGDDIRAQMVFTYRF